MSSATAAKALIYFQMKFTDERRLVTVVLLCIDVGYINLQRSITQFAKLHEHHYVPSLRSVKGLPMRLLVDFEH